MPIKEIRELIKMLPIELKHSGNEDERYSDQPQGVKEANWHHPEAQISEFTKAVLL